MYDRDPVFAGEMIGMPAPRPQPRPVAQARPAPPKPVAQARPTPPKAAPRPVAVPSPDELGIHLDPDFPAPDELGIGGLD
jgi:hypothetical protein